MKRSAVGNDDMRGSEASMSNEMRRGTMSDGMNRSSLNQNLSLDQANLWKSILNDVAQRDDVRESHVLVLGDRGAGKRSLIQALNKHLVRSTNKFIEVDKMGSAYAALDSAFLYVKDLSEKDALTSMVTSDDNLPRMNVWILQEQEKADLIK